jgi:ketosteroid isomerase-like protein
MMNELHRRRVLDLLDAFSAGDIERALTFCSDDVDFFSNAPVDILPHLGHHHGKDEVQQMWKTVHSRYSSMRYEMPFIAAEGDKVAVARSSASGATNGSCSSTSPSSSRFATARSPGFAKSSTPSI